VKRIFFCSLLVFVLLLSEETVAQVSSTQPEPWSKRIADSFLRRHPGAVTYDSGSPATKWNYEQGVMLIALHRMYLHTGAEQYFDFVSKNLDRYVDTGGKISTYAKDDFNLDNIAPGRVLLSAFQRSHDGKYRAAAELLFSQLENQPRTREGGFWHKKIYPNQMWLDGLFMAEPFYAMYAGLFGKPEAFDDIANQFSWLHKHTKDAKTGLYYHGWDESLQQRWADPRTGCSPSLWSRAMGWYGMGLVDVLDFFPKDHPRRNGLIAFVQELAEAIVKYRDEKSHLWYQVMDAGPREGNYLESSASAMFAYILAKGARKGYLDGKFLDVAQQTVAGLIEQKVITDAEGNCDLQGTCRSAGLGGTPYRDGSYDYYVHEPQRVNDLKGIGALLLALIETEGDTKPGTERGK